MEMALLVFMQWLVILIVAISIIVAEIISFADNGSELFYHLLRRWWYIRSKEKKKGKLPDDLVEIVAVKNQPVKNLTFSGEQLKLGGESDITLLVKDQLGCLMEMSAPFSVFEEMRALVNCPYNVDVVAVNRKMDRNDFNAFMLTHYTKRIAEIESKKWDGL